MLKTKKCGKTCLLFLAALFFVIFPSLPAAAQANYLDLGTPFYDPTSSDQQSCSAQPTASQSAQSTPNQIDLDSIAAKYGLQSAQAMKLGGAVIASYKADEPPSTPASTMKLIVADTFLRSGLDRSTSVPVTKDVYYNGVNDLHTNTTTLGNALLQMLKVSSNTGANVLIKALGGPSDFTQKAHSYGYTHTNVAGYYDPSNDGKNSSTISDQVKAMDHLFSGRDSGYSVAQDALEAASKSDNHYGVDDDANKWAGTSTVAGNVGKFKVGGQDYIIGLYKNAASYDAAAISAMKSGSSDIAAALGGISGGPTTTASATTCCQQSTTVLSGKNNANKVYNYFVGRGLSAPQLAGIMGNLQSESGFDPTIVYGGGHSTDPANVSVAWGLGQWLPGHRIIGIQQQSGVKGDVTLLATQLDIMWWELNNTSPTGTQHMIDGLKKITNYVEATHYWQQYYEGSLGQNDAGRITAAQDWLTPTDTAVTPDTPAPAPTSCVGVSAIVQEALALSWPDSSHGTTPTDAYAKAYQDFNPNGPGIADCGGFVATVMHASGADKSYPPGGTFAQAEYVKSHPELYDVVENVSSTADLLPGDILIVNEGSGEGVNGHTMIYVGPQPPSNFDQASASLNDRAANLGKAILDDHRGNYIRARLK